MQQVNKVFPTLIWPFFLLCCSSQSTAGEKLLRDGLWKPLWESEWSVHVGALVFQDLCLSVTWHWSNFVFSACFFPSRMANCRTETVTADMHLCPKRRRTWRCSGGEGSVALSSLIKLHSRWTVWNSHLIINGAVHLPFLCVPASDPLFDLSFCLLCVCRHVMNELLETERAYVEELLCVLQVFIHSSKCSFFCLLQSLAFHVFLFCFMFTGICLWDG